ncbi:tRNA (pseudouridine(54)-N(1))-methyltransferase TrmY [Oligoflexia bacterium]|nr:tRNA (pseudouridine(54)-N(1))-methyltransferase TrmY [Oligoflexia bacterium]
MRIFILRARKGPTASKDVDAALGGTSHFEVIAHTLVSALCVAKHTRDDVVVHVVLEATSDYSRTVTFDSRKPLYLGGFHEAAVIKTIKKALDASKKLDKEERCQVADGISVTTISFEHLVKKIAEDHPLYILDKKGEDVRAAELSDSGCFILTDHIPMPKKTLHLLKRLGVNKLNLGPKMLFAAHCVVLVHNELDRRGG